MGDFNRAIADFDQAVKLKPDLAEALLGRGFAFGYCSENSRPVTDLHRYLELRPNADNRKAIEDMILQLELQKLKTS